MATQRGEERTGRLMLDPSLVLQPKALAWIEELSATVAPRQDVFVSNAFMTALLEPKSAVLRYFRRQDRRVDVHVLRELLDGFPTFSYRYAGPDELGEGAWIVQQALTSSRSPARYVLADEWAFLSSQSWIASRSRRVFDAFVAAGAAVIHVGRAVLEGLVSRTLHLREGVPDALTHENLKKAGIKWVAVGGTAAASIATPVFGAFSAFIGGAVLLLDP